MHSKYPAKAEGMAWKEAVVEHAWGSVVAVESCCHDLATGIKQPFWGRVIISESIWLLRDVLGTQPPRTLMNHFMTDVALMNSHRTLPGYGRQGRCIATLL